MANRSRILIAGFVVVSAIVPIYVLSILWRVSVAEQTLYGRSDLIPLRLKQRQCSDPPGKDSHQDGTFIFARASGPVVVYAQLINSFQHAFGSALAAYELGRRPADLLFRANEYFEAICWKNSGTLKFYLDTRKDLANNAAGREIGRAARANHLNGAEAERFMVAEVLRALDDGRVLKHCQDSTVNELPTLSSFGCPLLAEIQMARRTDKSLLIK